MRILVANAYFLSLDHPKMRRSGAVYPPLATLLMAALLRREGYRVEVFDATLASGPEAFADVLRCAQADVCLLYEDHFHYLSKMCLERMRRAACLMVGEASRRGLPVLISSADAVDHPQPYLEAGAWAVLRTGNEALVLACLEAIARGGGRGDPVSLLEPGAVAEPDLDELPDPAWDLVDMERYRRFWIRHHGYVSFNLNTSRGCPYGCAWCAKPLFGRRYRAQSPERVLEQVRLLARAYGAEHIWFMDDIFGLQPGWLERWAELVESRGPRLPYRCLQRADLLRRLKAFDPLARSGCRTLWMGVESGSVRVLKAMRKGIDPEDVRLATNELRRRGIRVGWFLQFGYPEETPEDIACTWALVRELVPDEIGISTAYPLPGTEFFERARFLLGERTNWAHADDVEPIAPAYYRPHFYPALHRELHARHRIWRLRAGREPIGPRSLLVLGWALSRALYWGLVRRLRARPDPRWHRWWQQQPAATG
jgi:anaerobic magnesium-protoporphyrin IX monomethyl ester cyclase|nr:MAG: Mg-protoporphyrin IX monomethyl ester oxidative cyclase [Bacteroidota bacterium]